MAREKISKFFKINLVLQALQQNLSVKDVANTNSISEGQLRDWIRKYKTFVEEVLEDNRGNNSFLLKKFLKEKIKS